MVSSFGHVVQLQAKHLTGLWLGLAPQEPQGEAGSEPNPPDSWSYSTVPALSWPLFPGIGEEEKQLNNPPPSYGIVVRGFQKQGKNNLSPPQLCHTEWQQGTACAGGVKQCPPTQLSNDRHWGQGWVGCQHILWNSSMPCPVTTATRTPWLFPSPYGHWQPLGGLCCWGKPCSALHLWDFRPLLWRGTSGMARCPTWSPPPPSLGVPVLHLGSQGHGIGCAFLQSLSPKHRFGNEIPKCHLSHGQKWNPCILTTTLCHQTPPACWALTSNWTQATPYYQSDR